MSAVRPVLLALLLASTAPVAAAVPDADAAASAWIAATRSAEVAVPAAAGRPVRSRVIPATAPAVQLRRMAPVSGAPALSLGGIPPQLDAAQRIGYRAVFAALRGGRAADAATTLAAMPEGALHPVARAELALARGWAGFDGATLASFLAADPELPQVDRLAALARARGVADLPTLPVERNLQRIAGAPRRKGAPATVGDAAATAISAGLQKLLVAGRATEAEAQLAAKVDTLSADSKVEWQQRIAWGYYITGYDAAAARMAAIARTGMGPWAVQADWTAGLAAWRQSDCDAAAGAFGAVVRRARDPETTAAGLFWAARAETACGRPQKVGPLLRSAARYTESFYGLLAVRALGLSLPSRAPHPDFVQSDWSRLSARPNARVAAALVEIGERTLADRVLKHQAAIGEPADHPALLRLASQLNLPATQFWLAHNAPAGAALDTYARYPSPQWLPARGWRVDKALIFAHALQESGFATDAVSRAGARGVMQLMPATAKRMQTRIGTDVADLTDPAFNIECGQSYLEELRDQPTTGGLLPKVIAAYNAGPMALPKWNMGSRADADPLLYIESIPYAETRAYVVLVLRNYWMYERESGEGSASLTALAQGLWPRFPGLPGKTAVRMERLGLARAD